MGWLRVVAAVFVATWSPGHMYCCCNANDGSAERGLDRCGADAAEKTACCAPEKTDRALASLIQTNFTQNSPGPVTPCSDRDPADRSCGCVHGPVDAPLPAVTVLPGAAQHGQADLDLLLEAAPVTVRVGFEDPGRCCRGSPHGPPALTTPSLLSLSCQLTV